MSYLSIPLSRLALSLGLVIVSIALSRRWALALEKELAIGALRAALQLIAIGYALQIIFSSERPALVLATLSVMTLVAAWTAASRVEHGPSRARLATSALLAIATGAASALVPVFLFVVVPRPWYEARYLVPIGGMMLSSAMNVVAQTFERLFSAARSDAASIEARLSLGATPAQALAPHARIALRAALTPTINGLVTVGLVALPGMMTGQIVSGTPPVEAVRYQLVIMYQLVAVASVSGATAAWLARRMLFTERGALVP